MEADVDAGAEVLVAEPLQSARHVPECDVVVDGEAFDLVEHGRVGRVQGVAPKGASGHDVADGGRGLLHEADLHRRRVGAEQEPLAFLA